MLLASLYIILCSARNRIRVRLRRLREPRYFIGAIVGAAYIYFSFFARFRASRASSARRNARGARLPAPLAQADDVLRRGHVQPAGLSCLIVVVGEHDVVLRGRREALKDVVGVVDALPVGARGVWRVDEGGHRRQKVDV